MVKFQCPECKAIDLHIAEEQIACKECKRIYQRIFGEIFDFSPAKDFKDAHGYSFTYSYNSRIYELWRKSFLMKLTSGLSYQEELNLVLGRLSLMNGMSLLDVGCGTGIFTRQFAELYPTVDVWGLDYSYSQLRQALIYKNKGSINNLHFVHGLATKLPFEDTSFNRIFTTGAMHFFGNLELFFDEVYRVLKKDGVFVAESYLSYNSKPSDSWLIRRIQKRALKTTHFFSQGELKDLSDKAGFKDYDYSEKGIAFVLRICK